MRFRLKTVPAILAFSLAATAFGQPPADPSPVAVAPAVVRPSSILRPALENVQSTTADLRISKWKVSGDVRKAAEGDVDSIQRDLGGTLPALLARADAAPGSVPLSFAVYRNVDALYDVLLRVSQTADLAASSREAVMIADSLKRLEAARSQLADSILNTSQRHEAQLVALEAAARSQGIHANKKETIIEDGPEKKPAKRTSHRTTRKKTTSHPK